VQYEIITIDENELKKLNTNEFTIEDIEIKTDEEYKNVCELLKKVKGKANEIKEFFKEPKAKAYENHKSISSMEKDHLNKLSNFEKLAKDRIGSFLLSRENSNTIENPLDTLKVKGVSSSDVYKWRIINEDKIPKQYMMVNDKAINAIIKQTNGRFKIEGIEIYKEKSIRVKGE